jgi:tripartite-type tricarboxylate transporter receptor subunit TctC
MNARAMTRRPLAALFLDAAVVLVATTPYILVVNPAVPAATTAELLALVRAQPGKLSRRRRR